MLTIALGILLSGNECSQIMLSLLLTYFGGHGHRPRLVSLGVICSGISSLLIIVPHFAYGRSTPAPNCKSTSSHIWFTKMPTRGSRPDSRQSKQRYYFFVVQITALHTCCIMYCVIVCTYRHALYKLLWQAIRFKIKITAR